MLFLAFTASSQAFNNFQKLYDSWTFDYNEWTIAVETSGIWHFVGNTNTNIANYNSPFKWKIAATNNLTGKVYRFNIIDNWNGHITYDDDGGYVERKHTVWHRHKDPVYGFTGQLVITQFWTIDRYGNLIDYEEKIHVEK